MNPLSLLLGSIVGLVLGLLGGGGSVLAIPSLTYGLAMEAKPAVATSLVVVGVAALLASIVHARSGHVRLKIALAFGLLGGAGALAGSQLARLLSGTLQLVLFAAIMLVAGVRMVRGSGEEQASDGEQREPPRALTLGIALAALATGVVTGVVGVGGGFLIVPALVFLVGLPMREAVGTSLVVIVLNAVGGSLGYLAYVEIDLHTTLPFVVGAAGAGVVGSWLGQRISPRVLRVAFGVGIVTLAVAMGAKEGWALWSS